MSVGKQNKTIMVGLMRNVSETVGSGREKRDLSEAVGKMRDGRAHSVLVSRVTPNKKVRGCPAGGAQVTLLIALPQESIELDRI